jgi:two-component system chemotaxis response regulator CheB
MGASAGGIEALRQVLRRLSPGFSAPIFIVLHTSSEGPGLLASVLGRSTGLPVAEAVNHAPIFPGRVYVAPGDHHLALEPGHMLVTRGPRENRQRPSIDVLFRSAARAYGKNVIAVLLSGLLDDGTAGLQELQARGGKIVIQDPNDAVFPSMPLNALQLVHPDSVSSATEMGPLLAHLVNGKMAEHSKTSSSRRENSEATERPTPGPLKRPMLLSCPDCNGVLQEFGEGKLMRFRCQVGHEFSPDGLVEAQNDEVERALWTAVRALLESAAVARRLAEAARNGGRLKSSERYEDQRRVKNNDADLLRKLILNRNALAPPETSGNGQAEQRSEKVHAIQRKPPNRSTPSKKKASMKSDQEGATSGSPQRVSS